MRVMFLVLVVLVILLASGVLLLRKCYIDWCRCCRNRRRSRELQDRMEFYVRFIAVMLLLLIFVATMIVDCLEMEGWWYYG